jgi:hypothetical protein
MCSIIYKFSSCSDAVTLLLMHFSLFTVFAIACWKSLYSWWVKNYYKGTKAELTVGRGNDSMTALYTSFAIVITAFTLAIDLSEFAKGHKSTLIILDYGIFTYLFYFNSWFRNIIVFPLTNRAKRD